MANEKFKKGAKVTIKGIGDGVVKGYDDAGNVLVALYKEQNGKQVENELPNAAKPELVELTKKK